MLPTSSLNLQHEILSPFLLLCERKGILLEASDSDSNLCGIIAAISWRNIFKRNLSFEHREFTEFVKYIGNSGWMEDDTILLPFLYLRDGREDALDALLSRVTGKDNRHPVVVFLWDDSLNTALKSKGFSLHRAEHVICLRSIARLERISEAKPVKPCITGRKCQWKDIVGCTFTGDALPCLRLPESGKFSHSDLVDLAMRWLDAKKFKVIISEPGYRREQPDAVGFRDGGFSCLVECKASRSDFLRDKDKPFRKDPATGIGTMRIYLTAPGVCTPDELPEGWQLIEALDLDTLVLKHGAKGCLEMNKDFIFHKKLWQAEWDLLYSWAYRKLNSCLKPVPRTGRSLKIIEEDI